MLEFYLLFAFTTAIVANIELFLPVLYEIKQTDPDNSAVQAFKTTIVTLSCLAFAVAPLVFFACIFPSVGRNFREGLMQGFTAVKN